MSKTDTKHSPAPWRLVTQQTTDEEGELYGTLAIMAADDTIVTIDGYSDNRREPQFANARVMTLAPEMLAMLKKVYKCVAHPGEYACNTEPDERKVLAKEVRNLIKKAKGETT